MNNETDIEIPDIDPRELRTLTVQPDYVNVNVRADSVYLDIRTAHGSESIWVSADKLRDAIDEVVGKRSGPTALRDFEDAWERAEVADIREGDVIIRRIGPEGDIEYSIRRAISDHDVDEVRRDGLLRLIERAPEKVRPEWTKAKVIRADFEGERVVLARDASDDLGDFFVTEGRFAATTLSHLELEDELSNVEILVVD